MHLRNLNTGELSYYAHPEDAPPYATLSHCLQLEEIHSRDVRVPELRNWKDIEQVFQCTAILQTYLEIVKSQARNITMIWVDFLCIDRASNSELSDAINSMSQIYSQCQISIVYLSDVSTSGIQDPAECIRQSCWSLRIWSLQEVIASKDMIFYDKTWSRIGSKTNMLSELLWIFQLEQSVLEDPDKVTDFSIGRRLSWAAGLVADRPEDMAYALLGLLGINMTVNYGEGQGAFLRLQEEILKATDDLSILAWKSTGDQRYRGILANSPSEFSHFGVNSHHGKLQVMGCIEAASAGLLVDGVFGISPGSSDIFLRLVDSTYLGNSKAGIGIALHKWKDTYVRSSPDRLFVLDELSGQPRKVCLRHTLSTRDSELIAMQSSILSKENKGPLGRRRGMEETYPSAQITNHQVPLDPRAYIKPGRYALTQDKQGRISISLQLGQSSISLGKMTPLRLCNGNDSLERKARASREFYSEPGSKKTQSGEQDLLPNSSNDASSSSPELPMVSHLFEFTYPVSDETESHRDAGNDTADAIADLYCDSLLEWLDFNEKSESLVKRRPRMGPFTFKRSVGVYEEPVFMTDSEDEDTVLVGSNNGENRCLACPFQFQIPNRETSGCIAAGFQTISHLKRHLLALHRRPYYCPVCFEIFDLADNCDEHIRERSCDSKPAKKITGLSNSQMKQITRRADPSLPESEQWYSLWATAFPAHNRPPTPYTSISLQSVMRILWRFWLEKGSSTVSDCLKQLETRRKEDSEAKPDVESLTQKIWDHTFSEVWGLCTKVGLGSSFDEHAEVDFALLKKLLENRKHTLTFKLVNDTAEASTPIARGSKQP